MRERQRHSMGRGRGRGTDGLHAEQGAWHSSPSQDPQTMTWAHVRGFIDWAAQVPQEKLNFNRSRSGRRMLSLERDSVKPTVETTVMRAPSLCRASFSLESQSFRGVFPHETHTHAVELNGSERRLKFRFLLTWAASSQGSNMLFKRMNSWRICKRMIWGSSRLWILWGIFSSFWYKVDSKAIRGERTSEWEY